MGQQGIKQRSKQEEQKQAGGTEAAAAGAAQQAGGTEAAAAGAAKQAGGTEAAARAAAGAARRNGRGREDRERRLEQQRSRIAASGKMVTSSAKGGSNRRNTNDHALQQSVGGTFFLAV